MGCVTSKVMTRTGSFQEELNRSLKRRHGGFPALEELLISSSRHARDRFLDFCNADEKEANKIPTQSITSSESSNDQQTDDEHHNPETINTWDLMEGLDEQGQEEEEEEDVHPEPKQQQYTASTLEGSAHIGIRSQSFHWSSSDYESPNGVRNGDTSTNISIRSRSFHTVDEYDAMMMERNGWSNTKADNNWEDKLDDFLSKISKTQTPYPLVNISKKCCEDKIEMVKESESKIEIEGVPYLLARDAEETGSLALIAYSPENTNTGTKSKLITSSSIGSSCTNGNVTDKDKKGVRRKARAKDLTLAIPSSTIEFPVVASLKGWIDDTQVVNKGQLVHYSPAGDYTSYVTPRFGNFGSPLFSTSRDTCIEEEQESVFDPEMVSSYEVAMEQLQVEEEFLLKHITTTTLNDNKDDELVT